MSRRPPKPAPVVVKRASEERKRLPPELEAFARSDEEKLRIRRPRVDRGRVNDPREGYVIPGVANRDARSVYDERVRAMQQLWQGGAADQGALEELGVLLLDAQRLGLWRARRVMGFGVFCEDVVGVPKERARELAEAASLQVRESPSLLSERDVALWMRTEAGLQEGEPEARARVRSTEAGAVLELRVSLAKASAALSGVGARHLPLAREAGERPAGHEPQRERGGRAEPEPAWEQPATEEQDGVVDADNEASGEAPEGARETREAPSGGARLLTRKARSVAESDEEASSPAREHGEHSERPSGFKQPREGERPLGRRPRTQEGAAGGGFKRGGDERRGGAHFERGARGFERREGGARGERSFDRREGGARGERGFDRREGGARGERGFDRREGGARGERGFDKREGGARGERGFGKRDGGSRGERGFGGAKQAAGGRGFGKKPGFDKGAGFGKGARTGGGARAGGKGGFGQGAKGGFGRGEKPAAKGGFARGKGGFGQKRVFEGGQGGAAGSRRERPRDDDNDE